MELFRLLGKIAIDNTEANTAIDDTSKKAKDAEGKTSKSFGGIGKAAGTIAKGMVGVGAVLGGALIGAVESTRDYRKEMGQLETAFTQSGHSSNAAKQTFSDLNSVLGDSGQATEAAQQLAMLTDNEKDLDTMTNALTGVYATFGEALPVEGLAEAANHTAKVGEVQGNLADALEWSGVSVDSFNAELAKCNSEQERQSLITSTLNDLYGEAGNKYKEVNKDVIEAEKAQSRLTDATARVGAIVEPVMTAVKNAFANVLEAVLPFAESMSEKIPGAVGKVKSVFETAMPYIEQVWNGTIEVLKTAWETVGKPVFDFLKQSVMQAVDLFKKNFPAIKAVVSDVFNIIKDLWNNVLKPVLKILGDYIKNTLLPIWKTAFDAIKKVVQTAFDGIIKLWNGSLKPILKGIIDFVSGVLTGDWKKAWNGIKSIVSGVFTGIKTVISNAIDIIKSVFSGGLSIVKKTVSTVFGNIKDSISEKMDAAKEKIKGVIDKIKGWFNTTLKFKGLKMPKIKLTMEKGSGLMAKAAEVLGLDGVPKFSVTWNASGGILNRPTIFGRIGNTLLGGGESGKEAIAPIDILQEYVRNAVRQETSGIVEAIIEQNRLLIEFLQMYMPKSVLLDSGALVGELSPAINTKLGEYYKYENRGNTR